MSDMESRDRIYWLIDEYKSGNIDTQTFCTEFERLYNFELKKDLLLKVERQAFSRLFDRVVYYSPFPDERARIANYLGEDDIRAAVDDAFAELRHSPISPN